MTKEVVAKESDDDNNCRYAYASFECMAFLCIMLINTTHDVFSIGGSISPHLKPYPQPIHSSCILQSSAVVGNVIIF